MSAQWATWREDLGGTAFLGVLAAGAWLLVVQPGADAREHAIEIRTSTHLLQGQVAMVLAQSRAAQEELTDHTRGAGPHHPLRAASEFNSMLALLNQAAVANGIALDRIAPGPVDRAKETTRFRLNVAGLGSYPSTIDFLIALREQFPDVTVTGLSAQRGTEDTGDQPMLSIDLAWHAQPDAKPTSSDH